MKKLIIACVLLFACLGGASQSFAEKGHVAKKHCLEKIIGQDKMDELVKKGFSKHDIVLAALIGKKAEKSVDEVLAYHQKNQSTWEKTAEHFGVDLEKLKHRKHHLFYQKNKDVIIKELASYSNMKEPEIHAYLDNEIPLKSIVFSAVIAKLSDMKVDDIIKQKQSGKNFVEITKELNIDHSALHEELKNFHQQVKINMNKTTAD